MSNNKQSSSIDFFWNQLPEILPFSVDTETAVKLWEAFEQAKAMHKEEMDKVAGDFWNEGASYVSDGKRKYNSFDEYYNETFGGNNED